jgi:hypothetical protein
MKTTCWCGYTQIEHPIFLSHHFDNTEATWKAYCKMYMVTQEDYKNNHSFLNKIIKWIWK